MHSFTKLALALGLASTTMAGQAEHLVSSGMAAYRQGNYTVIPNQPVRTRSAEERSFSCDSPVSGLSVADCEWMSQIGMYAQGINDYSDNGLIWIGNNGPNIFSFGNIASEPINVIVWYQDDNPINYDASFMNVEQPYISYSLAVGTTIEISMANGVSGGFAAIHQGITTLSQYGQIYQTWGEFTSGNYATIDISREVNMDGDTIDILVSGGCQLENTKCAYVCYSGNTCGTAGSYELLDCLPGSQPNAAGAFVDGEWTGGCQGWSNSGLILAAFSD